MCFRRIWQHFLIKFICLVDGWRQEAHEEGRLVSGLTRGSPSGVLRLRGAPLGVGALKSQGYFPNNTKMSLAFSPESGICINAGKECWENFQHLGASQGRGTQLWTLDLSLPGSCRKNASYAQECP